MLLPDWWDVGREGGPELEDNAQIPGLIASCSQLPRFCIYPWAFEDEAIQRTGKRSGNDKILVPIIIYIVIKAL